MTDDIQSLKALAEQALTSASWTGERSRFYAAASPDVVLKLIAALNERTAADGGRTPGTVEVCERNALAACVDYPGRHDRAMADCKVFACPIRSTKVSPPRQGEG